MITEKLDKGQLTAKPVPLASQSGRGFAKFARPYETRARGFWNCSSLKFQEAPRGCTSLSYFRVGTGRILASTCRKEARNVRTTACTSPAPNMFHSIHEVWITPFMSFGSHPIDRNCFSLVSVAQCLEPPVSMVMATGSAQLETSHQNENISCACRR